MELVIPVHQTWENLLIFFLGFCDKSRSQFFWVLIQLGETTTLFKIPFTLGAGCFGCYRWPGFLPSIFLFLFVLYACPQISVQIYMWEYIPTNVRVHKRVCIYTGKGRVMLDCGWTMLAMSSRFMKEKYFCHLLAFNWKQSNHRLRSSCRHDARRYNLQVQTCSDILVS